MMPLSARDQLFGPTLYVETCNNPLTLVSLTGPSHDVAAQATATSYTGYLTLDLTSDLVARCWLSCRTLTSMVILMVIRPLRTLRPLSLLPSCAML